jgi:hypothetical protein
MSKRWSSAVSMELLVDEMLNVTALHIQRTNFSFHTCVPVTLRTNIDLHDLSTPTSLMTLCIFRLASPFRSSEIPTSISFSRAFPHVPEELHFHKASEHLFI